MHGPEERERWKPLTVPPLRRGVAIAKPNHWHRGVQGLRMRCFILPPFTSSVKCVDRRLSKLESMYRAIQAPTHIKY